jgi:hypothetical protein
MVDFKLGPLLLEKEDLELRVYCEIVIAKLFLIKNVMNTTIR